MTTNALRAAAVKTKFLENYEFVFLKEDILRFISSTKLFPSNIRGLRYTGLKKGWELISGVTMLWPDTRRLKYEHTLGYIDR